MFVRLSRYVFGTPPLEVGDDTTATAAHSKIEVILHWISFLAGGKSAGGEFVANRLKWRDVLGH